MLKNSYHSPYEVVKLLNKNRLGGRMDVRILTKNYCKKCHKSVKIEDIAMRMKTEGEYYFFSKIMKKIINNFGMYTYGTPLKNRLTPKN